MYGADEDGKAVRDEKKNRKSHRLPSSSKSVYTSLDLVYSNLWGPSHVSSTNGFLYYITLVDACSHFTWIYLLKSKSETLNVFQ